jgi:hypothetical protein
MAAHESDRINLKKKSYSADLVGSIWIEDLCLPEGKLFGLHSGRVLVKEKAEIGCRLVGRRNREKHLIQFSLRTMVRRTW